jgi:glucose/arabinose dehydrogenase
MSSAIVSRKMFRLLILLLLAVSSARASVASINLPLREPIRGYGFSNLFPQLKFSQPVGIACPPGESNRLFVVEQSGRIVVVRLGAEPELDTFLDLRENLWVTRESGLLSLAFHPDFAANGRFFTYRIVITPDHRFQFRLSEFRCDPHASHAADAATEKILISDYVMDEEHNAGALAFGPDGFLYLAIGEENSGSPAALARPQRIDHGLFGGILRLDVDGRPGSLRPNPHAGSAGDYWIPADNPFVGATSFLGRAVAPGAVRTEFYAVGLRNPWRFSFDPLTGQLICADVGSAFFEEINVVERGANYGWPFWEGGRMHAPAPAGSVMTAPAYAYPRESGTCIIGGLICRSPDLPDLHGKYLFADFVSGSVWARDLASPSSPTVWLGARTGISTFAHAHDGGVLLASHTDGAIYRLVAGGEPLPNLLSETGAFANLSTLQPSGKAMPFEVNSPLWSDGAEKIRWASFSKARGPIQIGGHGQWRYPAGAVWIKHFELEMTNGMPGSRRRLETRFLVKTETDVYGLTYRWNESQTDAALVPPEGLNETLLVNDAGTIHPQVWRYPAAEECRTCHNATAGYVLGFTPQQLNRTITVYGAATNQIDWFASHGIFDAPTDPKRLPKLSGLEDQHAPLLHKARSYLESNCVQCHQPGGRSLTDWDARLSTPLHAAKLLGASPVFFPPVMKVVDPGQPLNSLLLNKVSTRTPGFAMPPLASSVIDQQFTNILAQWIATLPGPGWVDTNVGPAIAEGAAELRGGVIRLSSAGGGYARGSYLFAGRAVVPEFEIVSRIPAIRSESPNAEAGLAVQAGPNTLALIVNAASLRFSSGEETLFASVRQDEEWLKLGGTASNIQAWLAGPAKDWRLVASAALSEAPRLAGFIAASGNAGAEFAAADFSEHALAGAIDEVTIPNALPEAAWSLPTAARFLGADTNTLGSWRGRYGRSGHWLIGAERRLPDWLALAVHDADPSPFVEATFLPQALQQPEGDGRFAQGLFGLPSFDIELAPLDGAPSAIGFYLLDFNYRRRVLDITVETLQGALLDRQVASDFSRGKHLLWEIAGPVRFRFHSPAFAAGVSAIFVDRGFSALELLRNNQVPPSSAAENENAFLADSDGDGVSNGLEYFLGFDPFAPADAPNISCRIDGQELALTLSRRSLEPAAKLSFRASFDLRSWNELAPSRSTIRGGVPPEIVFYFPRPGAQLFLSIQGRPAE